MMKIFGDVHARDLKIGGLGFFVAGGLAGVLTLGLGLAVASAAGSRTPAPAVPAGAPPAGLRQALADTCPGYNAALVEAAALAQRINKPQEAARFMGMRVDCAAQSSPLHRSAR